MSRGDPWGGTQAGQESGRVPACWLPAPGEERGSLQQQMKPRETPRYPSPALVLSAHAARKKRRANSSAWAGTVLRTEASSSDLPPSWLLEEPRRCGPVTQKLLRNLKQKRDGLSCVGREGRAGVPPGAAGALAGSHSALGESTAQTCCRMEQWVEAAAGLARPALPVTGAALPCHGPPLPL